jgi:hypothetical protein
MNERVRKWRVEAIRVQSQLSTPKTTSIPQTKSGRGTTSFADTEGVLFRASLKEYLGLPRSRFYSTALLNTISFKNSAKKGEVQDQLH